MHVLRHLLSLSILSAVLAAPLLAQENLNGPAPVAESTPADIAVGYSYMNLSFSGKRVNLSGVDASATINFNPSWGVNLDSNYVRAGRDIESGHSSYVLSGLMGPVFVPAQYHNTRLLVRALAGMSLVDGSVRVNDVYYRGWQSRFSWAIGTGIERNLSTSFAVRFNVDYLRTHFLNSTATVQPQNGIRLGANFVFRLSPRRGTR